jgi:hypothetical protein
MRSIIAWVTAWKPLSIRTAVVSLIVVYTLLGFLLVPVVAKKILVDTARERAGRDVTVEQIRSNPFTLSLTIRGLSGPDRAGSTLVSVDELYANAQLSSLFRWAITLKELRVVNPYLALRRFPDGGVNALELLEAIRERQPGQDELDEGSGLPRILLQHVLVTGSTIDVEDLARDEPLELTLGPSVYEFHDISTIPGRRGDNQLALGMLGGRVDASGDVVVEPLGLHGTVTADGISLTQSWPLLEPYFRFAVAEGRVGGRFDYSIELRNDSLHVRLSDLDARAEGLALTLRNSDTRVLDLPLVVVTDASLALPEAEVAIAEVLVDGAAASVWLEPDGTLGLVDLVPEETRNQVVTTYRRLEEAFAWAVAIDRFEISNASAQFEDRSFGEPVQLAVDDLSLALGDIITGRGHEWGLAASARLPGESRASVQGVVLSGPMRIETAVGITDLQLAQFQPYVARIAPLELMAGTLRVDGRATLDPKGDGPIASFAGQVTVQGLDVFETAVGSRVLRWGRVDSRGIEASVRPLGLHADSIDVHGAAIDVVMSEQGEINLIEVVKTLAARRDGDEPVDAPTPEITVDLVTLHESAAAYTDRTLDPAFTVAVTALEGVVRDVSSSATAGATLDIEGKVQDGGVVALEGEMDLFDPKRLTALTIDVRTAAMPPVSPMSVRYIGHPIDSGSVDIQLAYEIVSSNLAGDNRFVTDGLTLGGKVEGEGRIDLPVTLGVSLLTDKDGLITLDFPIEGNLDDPSFGLGSAIGSAARAIVGELIESPFRLLGRLGGGSSDEDFGSVAFRAGSAELDIAATDKLRTLAEGAEQRPDLILQVEGGYDPDADMTALQEAAFRAAMRERRGTDTVATGGSVSIEELESFYRETFPGATLDTLRARHVRPGGGEDAIDETAYYRDLRAALIAAQPVDSAQLGKLGSARADAIRALLVEAGTAPSRVQELPAAAVEPSDDGWVRCRLDVAAGR